MNPTVRMSRPLDLNPIKILDLKAYDYPLDGEEWKELVSKSGQNNAARVVVVEAYSKQMGFAVWRHESPKEGDDLVVTTLYRIGVLPGVRNKGLGSLMIKECQYNAQRNKSDVIRVTVPDFKCLRGDPDNVSGFLHYHGFNATGEVIDEYKFMYGEWRDGFVFEKTLGVAHVIA